MADYTVSLKLDINKFMRGSDDVKKEIEKIEGVHDISFVSDAKPALDSIARIGLAITGINQGLQLVKSAFNYLNSIAIKPAADFEVIQTRLISLYGNVDKATEVFEYFKQVAATTPFDLLGIANAGAQLKAFGLDAEKTIKPITDLAAYMGVDVVEAANSVGRAFAGGAGAADILRERGILTLIRDFNGIDDLTKLTLPEFRNAMIKTFMDPASGIAGSTDRLSKTYVGAISNMKDALVNLSNAVGSTITPVLSDLARKITEGIEKLTPMIKDLVSMLVSVAIGAVSGYAIQLTIANKSTIALAFSSTTLLGVLKSLWVFLNTNAVFLLATAIGFLYNRIMKAKEITGEWKDVLWVFAFGMTKISHIIMNIIMAVGESILWLVQTVLNPTSELIKAIFDSIKLAISGDFEAAGTRITSGLLKGIKSGQKDINATLKATWKNIVDDPMYDALGEALYDKIGDKAVKKAIKGSTTSILPNITSSPSQTPMNSKQASLSGEFSIKELKESDITPGADKDESVLIDYEKLLQDQVDALIESELEKHSIRIDFNQMQYDLTTSAEQKRFDVINEYYTKNRDLLIEAGITEDEIETQRQLRLKKASDGYRELSQTLDNVQQSLENGLSSALNDMLINHETFSKSIKSAWKSIANSVIAEINKMIAKWLVFTAIKSIFNPLKGLVSGGSIGPDLPSSLPISSIDNSIGSLPFGDIVHELSMVTKELKEIKNNNIVVNVQTKFKGVEFYREVEKATNEYKRRFE